jgi:16S rRNA (uracil1498-N3)-methyltransferase
MRLKKGALIVVVDGVGIGYRGSIAKNSVSGVHVDIHATIRNFGEQTVRLTLAAGLSTGLKFDRVVQMGTELGVTRFVPLVCEKSTVKIESEKKALARVRRLEKIALAAMKQCRRSYRPEITMPRLLPDFLRETDNESLNLFFHPSENALPLGEITVAPGLKRATAIVGPESGFSPDEAKAAISAGYSPVSLGRRVLRTETAGPVTVALVSQLLDQLN